MKKTVIIGIIMLLGAAAGLRAQDTIDNTYYRYDNHFYHPNGNVDYFLRDSTTGEYVVDPETGEYVPICPNGVGFREFCSAPDSLYIPHFYSKYHRYNLSHAGTRVYGIAISLDSVVNFIAGDALIVTLCERAEDLTHFERLDSIVIKGGEVGKRRWCEIPLSTSLLNTGYDYTVHDNCIDTVVYRQLLEIYFEQPVTLREDMLFWKIRVSKSNGTIFYISHVKSNSNLTVAMYDADCTPRIALSEWDNFFPLITPLPDWEVPTMDTVIPMPLEKPDNPDNPDDPNDPDDPDNPQNPNDPDDPDNPGGDEGIGRADAFGLTIYPNPASNSTVVTCDAEIQELSLRDINGRPVLTLRNCGTSTTLNTSTLTPGLYTLQVTTPAATTTRKLAVRP